MSTPDPTLHVNPQKARKGLDRLWHATLYSLNGLKAGWGEPAFRMEACLAIVLLPLAFIVGQSWIETALLVAGVLLVMIVELLNTAVEAAIDRIGPEWHDLSKRAKDMGSAAVFLTSLLAGGIWLAALWQRFIA
ncbi:diacylglycerol kinase [Pseudacidovorax sp. NFM-22]|uniref:diacylglycerol kinase n=1 Tax=Pseudacidovorax sp. NFM-22 TaxID=2744469 RepID=UPI001F24C7B6|nr:diacylglycerol kinase [Pseudacidovorax sp. NFM-22]